MDCEAATILDGIKDHMEHLSADATIKLPMYGQWEYFAELNQQGAVSTYPLFFSGHLTWRLSMQKLEAVL